MSQRCRTQESPSATNCSATPPRFSISASARGYRARPFLKGLVMPSHSARLRVVVVGGGVLGTSTARFLAREGAEVVLLTEGALANGASGRSLSWLNSFGN